MSVIPNKYLSNSGNRLELEPGSLLKADNVRIYDDRLTKRVGQQLVVPDDPAFIDIVPSNYADFVCVKLFFYNGRIWGYFVYMGIGNTGDIIGYYDTARNHWVGSQMYDYNVAKFWVDDTEKPPQMIESQRRLLVSTKFGIYVSPKLTKDELINGRNESIQTKIEYAGAPQALPLASISLVDTAATYNANWLTTNYSVAYRYVWKYVNANGTQVYGAPSDWKMIKNTAGAFRAVQMRIRLPVEALGGQQTKLVCEIYRTEKSGTGISGATIFPSDEMFFVAQLRPTATDIAASYMDFIDIIDDAALQFPLYTNETQDGVSAARIRPPIASCLEDFNGCAFYGNIKNRWSLPFELVSVIDSAAAVAQGLAPRDTIAIGDYCLEGAAGATTIAQNQFLVDGSVGYTEQFTRITNTAFSIAAKYNEILARTKFNLLTNSGPNQITGQFQLQETRDGAVPDGFTPYIGLYRRAGWSATAGTSPSPIVPTPLVTESKGKGFLIISMNSPGVGARVQFELDAAPDFVVGDTVNIARFPTYSDVTLPAGSQGDGILRFTPGQYVVSEIIGAFVKLTGVTAPGAFSVAIGAAPFTTTWNSFGVMHCVKTEDGYTSQAVGQQNVMQNRLMFSAYQEPENAPALNYFDIGASDKKIIAMHTLNKSMFIFKEDGLFRLSGDYPNFYVEQFDPNCILLGSDMTATMGSALYAMTTRGVYEITQNSMKRISQPIQSQLARTIFPASDNVKRYGFAVGHEQDHYVAFWMPRFDVNKFGPSSTTYSYIAYIYDGQGWTRRTDQAMGGACGLDTSQADPQYRLYTIKKYGTGWLTKQRKQFNGFDYCDEQLLIGTPTIVSPTIITAVVATDSGSFDSYVLENKYALIGACVYDIDNVNSLAYITGYEQKGPGTYDLTLEFVNAGTTTSAFAASTRVQIMLPIKTEWQWNINTAGDPTIRKHFTQVGIVYQQPYFTKGDIGFSSDVSPTTEYRPNELLGFFLANNNPNYWPLFTVDNDLQEKVIRTLVTTSKQRGSQLRVSVRHQRAAQFISVYGYFVRSSDGGKAIERNNAV